MLYQLSYEGMVPKVGVEPTSPALQAGAKATSATSGSARLVTNQHFLLCGEALFN